MKIKQLKCMQKLGWGGVKIVLFLQKYPLFWQNIIFTKQIWKCIFFPPPPLRHDNRNRGNGQKNDARGHMSNRDKYKLPHKKNLFNPALMHLAGIRSSLESWGSELRFGACYICYPVLASPYCSPAIHQKKINKLRRIKGAVNSGESPLTEYEKALVVKCDKTMELNWDETIDVILT